MDWKPRGNSSIEAGAVLIWIAYSPGEEWRQGTPRHGGRIPVICYCMSTTQLFISELIPLGSVLSQCRGIYGASEMSTYRWEVPPLVVLIIPANAGRPRMTRCRCLYLFRGTWPRKIAFGWENLDVTLKTFLSVPSLFFMEKEDVYPAPFLIPSSPGVHVSWNQHFDGCLKTFITKLKTLTCVVREHRSRCTQWEGYEHSAPTCLIHPMMAGPSKSPSPFSLMKSSSWVVTSCRWWRAVTAHTTEWWQ